MNSVYIALWCGFIISTAVNANDNFPRIDPPEQVTLRLIIDFKPSVVTLKKTETFLANEHLPIWTVWGDAPHTLDPTDKMMQYLGRFTMYQDSETSSSAVFFHRRRAFDGNIETHFVIDGYPIDKINDVIDMDSPNNLFITKINRFYHHEFKQAKTQDHGISISSSERSEMKLSKETEPQLRIRQDLPNVVYVKLLLILSYDLVHELQAHSDSNALLSYLLTLFNNVDMLFSKMNQPNIRINIAGVILAGNEDSFLFVNECYMLDKCELSQSIDVECVFEQMTSYIRKLKPTIPEDSFDIAILLTSSRLVAVSSGNNAAGVTSNNKSGPFKPRQTNKAPFSTIIVRNLQHFGSASVIAHEIVHGFGYHAHDKGPYIDEDGNCCAYIMRQTFSVCKRCLSWSSDTETFLREFFSSPNRCFFIKKPLSLEKSGPREIWTENDQCQCYGYNRALNPKRSFFDKLRGIRRGRCETNLECEKKNGNSFKAPFPMDGTPCGEGTNAIDKVCWNRECVPVREQEQKK